MIVAVIFRDKRGLGVTRRSFPRFVETSTVCWLRILHLIYGALQSNSHYRRKCRLCNFFHSVPPLWAESRWKLVCERDQLYARLGLEWSGSRLFSAQTKTPSLKLRFKGLNILGKFCTIFHNWDNFCEFLLVPMCTSPHCGKESTLKGKISLPLRSKFFVYRVPLFRRQTQFWQSPPPPTLLGKKKQQMKFLNTFVSFPRKWLWHFKQTVS